MPWARRSSPRSTVTLTPTESALTGYRVAVTTISGSLAVSARSCAGRAAAVAQRSTRTPHHPAGRAEGSWVIAESPGVRSDAAPAAESGDRRRCPRTRPVVGALRQTEEPVLADGAYRLPFRPRG